MLLQTSVAGGTISAEKSKMNGRRQAFKVYGIYFPLSLPPPPSSTPALWTPLPGERIRSFTASYTKHPVSDTSQKSFGNN